MDFYSRNYIEGLFLSSGIFQSPDATMEQLVRAVKLLRTTHNFNGYIHLKAIPGASPDLLKEAGRWVDRLSANIELPTQRDLSTLAPDKQHETIEGAMYHIKSYMEERLDAPTRQDRYAPAGQTTQMVIGATATSDADILTTADRLYREYALRRVYYSAFSPFPKADARLPLQPPPLIREHRLYQADWLMRLYGFECRELIETAQLDLERDPKLAWALRHRERFPVDVNTATREDLLRIPGVGYRNVARILSIRRYHRLTQDDLLRLRVAMNRAAPFLVAADGGARTLDDTALPARLTQPLQLALFESAGTARQGQL